MLMDVLPFTERVARRIAMAVEVPMATNCESAPSTFERCFFARRLAATLIPFWKPSSMLIDMFSSLFVSLKYLNTVHASSLQTLKHAKTLFRVRETTEKFRSTYEAGNETGGGGFRVTSSIGSSNRAGCKHRCYIRIRT